METHFHLPRCGLILGYLFLYRPKSPYQWYAEGKLSSVHGRSMGSRPGAVPEFVLNYGACSPLNLSEWKALHPNHSFVDTSWKEFNCIGFNRQHQLDTSLDNRLSSVPNIIPEHLERELSLGHKIKLPPYIPYATFTLVLLE